MITLPNERNITVIAEVKLWSPFGERLTSNTFEEQVILADKVGDMISILIHPIWKGTKQHLRDVRKLTSKLLLAKSIPLGDHDIKETVEVYGADHFLSVGRLPGVYPEKCFYEPIDITELASIPTNMPAVWNSRDLSILKDFPGIPQFILDRWKTESTGTDRKRETFDQARNVFAGPLVQASNLKEVSNIHPGADYVLVGTHLERFAASMGIPL
jgi:hypothetical protein